MYANCDQLAALAGHVEREYGGYGYHFEALDGGGMWKLVATVRHSDGSEFNLQVDRYGNVERLADPVVSPVGGTL